MNLITQKTMVWLHLNDLKERGMGLTDADREYIKQHGKPDETETLLEQRHIFGINQAHEEYYSEIKAALLNHDPDDEYMINLYKKAKRKQINYRKLSELTGLTEQWFTVNMMGDIVYIRLFKRLTKIKDPKEREIRVNNFIYVQHNRGITVNRIHNWCNYPVSKIKKIIKNGEKQHGYHI